MSMTGQHTFGLVAAFTALRKDLVHDEGPHISTMRNYRFAIVPYRPEEEFALRDHVRKLTHDLIGSGFVVLPISLQKLLLERVRAMGPEVVQRIVAMERATHARSPERGLEYLRSKLDPLIEGPDGIAADCSRLITDHARRHPEQADRMLAILGRAGAIYPFFRYSALLKHLDGRTANVPVVLLYPGERRDEGLSFMGIEPPHGDYRPRIYP
jgi:hypothetical protein